MVRENKALERCIPNNCAIYEQYLQDHILFRDMPTAASSKLEPSAVVERQLLLWIRRLLIDDFRITKFCDLPQMEQHMNCSI
jgi:hypothetical protein